MNKYVSTEIQRTWNVKCFVIAVVIWVKGIVSTGLKKYLKTIAIDYLQNTAVLGTSRIIRKVLQSETSSLRGGVHHWLKEEKYQGKENL
jgi:hypothetical protein